MTLRDLDLAIALHVGYVRPRSPTLNYTFHGSRKGSLCESTHAGILQDAQGTPIPQPCRFAANAAWLAIQVMAHNLDRWTARIGLGEQLATDKTLRRRFFSIAGRLTRSARRPPCICPSADPEKPSSIAPRPDCGPCHSQPDGGAGNQPAIRPTGRPSQLAPTRSARATSCLQPIEYRPPWPLRAAIIVSVWLPPHAALIPTYWNRAWPVRLSLPSTLVSTPVPILTVDSGLVLVTTTKTKCPSPGSPTCRVALHNLGSTGSLSSASTANAHSCTR